MLYPCITSFINKTALLIVRKNVGQVKKGKGNGSRASLGQFGLKSRSLARGNLTSTPTALFRPPRLFFTRAGDRTTFTLLLAEVAALKATHREAVAEIMP
jgi:hypothetical protein